MESSQVQDKREGLLAAVIIQGSRQRTNFQVRCMAQPGRKGAVYSNWDGYKWIPRRLWSDDAQTSPLHTRYSVHTAPWVKCTNITWDFGIAHHSLWYRPTLRLPPALQHNTADSFLAIEISDTIQHVHDLFNRHSSLAPSSLFLLKTGPLPVRRTLQRLGWPQAQHT